MIFIELFILKHKKSIVYKLAKLGLNTHTKFGFNLPATFFITLYKDCIVDIIGYADIVFANKHEAFYFAENIIGEVMTLLRKTFRCLKYALKYAN